MDQAQILSVWQKKYKTAEQQLEKTAHLNFVATAFNTNIDAVIKIDGKRISELIKDVNLSFENISKGENRLNTPYNVVRGIVKCFQNGIAEEWLVDDVSIYEWMQKNIGYDRLQMGGQGGIIANVLALTGISKVLAHTASHPKIQAEQFLNLPNLLAIDYEGRLSTAHQIDRTEDTPLIHWIIEFDKGDECEIDGHKIVCPKSNRFIATYDPLNSRMYINPYFIPILCQNKPEYLLLSGYNMLSGDTGISAIKSSTRELKKLKNANPEGIIHLEIASTQDKTIRKAIIDEVATIADSLGLNERETLDIIEVISPHDFQNIIDKEIHSPLLFDALCKIKEYTKAPRIQMHMFGLYVTLQDKKPLINSEESLKGMLTAATAAASKASLGKLENKSDLLYAKQNNVGSIYPAELQILAEFLHSPELVSTGVCEYGEYSVTAIPTILIEKPKTLVGMGDTISSLSLLCAR